MGPVSPMRGFESHLGSLLLGAGRRGRLAAGDVHEVLADHRAILWREGAAEGLLDHLPLAGRQVDEGPLPPDVVELGSSVLHGAVRLTVPLALLLVILLAGAFFTHAGLHPRLHPLALAHPG